MAANTTSTPYIEGGVDFIFGNATAVFDHSELHANEIWLPHRTVPHLSRPDNRLRHPQQQSHQQHRPRCRSHEPRHTRRHQLRHRPQHHRPRSSLAPLLPRHLYQHRTPRRPQPRRLEQLEQPRQRKNRLLRRIQLHRSRRKSHHTRPLVPPINLPRKLSPTTPPNSSAVPTTWNPAAEAAKASLMSKETSTAKKNGIAPSARTSKD